MSFNPENISILGASGAIGSAFTKLLSEKFPNASMFAFSRNGQHSIDYSREDSRLFCASVEIRLHKFQALENQEAGVEKWFQF
jgi:aspartate-semialdehyde dehydrogenase